LYPTTVAERTKKARGNTLDHCLYIYIYIAIPYPKTMAQSPFIIFIHKCDYL